MQVSILKISAKTIATVAVLCALASCASESTPPPPATVTTTAAFVPGEPGGVVVNTFEFSARVVEINQNNRKVTLLRADDTTIEVTAGPEVINFDQIGVGDLVNLTVTEEIVVYLGEAETPVTGQSAAIVSLAPKGGRPGGLMAQTIQTVGKVKSIDAMNRTATLIFEDGSEKTFAVRSDVDLTKHKQGEKVVFEVTEMVAVSVRKK